MHPTQNYRSTGVINFLIIISTFVLSSCYSDNAANIDVEKSYIVHSSAHNINFLAPQSWSEIRSMFDTVVYDRIDTVIIKKIEGLGGCQISIRSTNFINTSTNKLSFNKIKSMVERFGNDSILLKKEIDTINNIIILDFVFNDLSKNKKIHIRNINFNKNKSNIDFTIYLPWERAYKDTMNVISASIIRNKWPLN